MSRDRRHSHKPGRTARAAIAAAFVIPAGVAGYHVAADIVSLTSASQLARLIAGIGGATAVSWAALQYLVGGARTLAMPGREPTRLA